jgi:hypothetical protein
VLRILGLLLVLSGGLDFTQGTGKRGSELEAEVDAALKTDTSTFDERAALVERIDQARGQSSGETAARLSLLWLRGLKWMLSGIPLAQRNGEPNNAWLKTHQALVAWSEPAGEWLVASDVIWKLHDQYRDATVAEEIAWLAVENGLPGECEGYVPCYAVGMNQLDGEYLRRHPCGAHVAESIDRVKGTFDQALRLMAEPDGRQFLNPATDCGDLKAPLVALRAAIAAAPTSADRDQTVALADKILGMCP